MLRKIIFGLSIGLACVAQCSPLGTIHDSLVFLSPGVSGTHLTMINIYVATKRPVLLVKPRGYFRKYNPWGLSIEKGVKPYYHTHNPIHLHFIDKASNKLVLLIRNYRDWVLRDHISILAKQGKPIPDPLSKEDCLRILKSPLKIKQYYSYLRAFDNWPENSKMLLYYEDMVKQPKEMLQKIQTFLKVETDQLPKDLALLEKLNQKSKAMYNTRYARYGGSRSGNYVQSLTKADLQAADENLRSVAPKLFDQYLLRYQIK